MEGDERRQLGHVRERIQLLLDTHLRALPHETLRPCEGDVVIQQGAIAERVMLVLAGELTIEVESGKEAPQVLAIVGAQELIGEMGLVGDNRHSATVRVSRGPAELVAIRADDLLQASLYDSELVMELLALSSARCRRSNQTLALLFTALQALVQEDQLTLERSCADLASQVGTARSAAILLKTLAARLQQKA